MTGDAIGLVEALRGDEHTLEEEPETVFAAPTAPPAAEAPSSTG